MTLRFNDFTLANDFIAILGMLKLLPKIVGRTSPATDEQPIFGSDLLGNYLPVYLNNRLGCWTVPGNHERHDQGAARLKMA
jgi:hypothetical protein